MKNRSESGAGLNGIYLIDILASGVGIIVLLLAISITQRILLTKKKRTEKLEEIREQIQTYAKGGELPVQADLYPEDYDECYFEAQAANRRRAHSFPIFKLHENIIEIDESNQIIPVREVFSQKDELNNLNEYLSTLSKAGKNYFFSQRMSLHIYNPNLYYHFQKKLKQFDLESTCYHMFPKIELPEEYQTNYVIRYQMSSSDSTGTSNISGDKTIDNLTVQQNLLSQRMAQLSSEQEKLQDSLRSLEQRLQHPPADSTGSSDVATSNFQPELKDSIANQPNNIETDSSLATSKLSKQTADSLSEVVAPVDSVARLPQALVDSTLIYQVAEGQYITITIRLDDIKNTADSQYVNKKNSSDNQTAQDGQTSSNKQKQNTSEQSSTAPPKEEKDDGVAFVLSNEENFELIKDILEGKPIIRKPESSNQSGSGRKVDPALYNKIKDRLIPPSMGVSNSSKELPYLILKVVRSERPFLKIPLDVPITGVVLGVDDEDLKPYDIGKVMGGLFRLRKNRFAVDGIGSFLFHSDLLTVKVDSTNLLHNGPSWVVIGHGAGPNNPQAAELNTKIQYGFVMGKVVEDSLVLDYSLNAVELMPVKFAVRINEPGKPVYWQRFAISWLAASILLILLILNRKK